jgi:hypothetical protein
MRIVFFMLMIIFLQACSKNASREDVMPSEKMQLVMWDMIRADVLATELSRKDSSLDREKENIKLQKKVFFDHKISREIFRESFDYYTKNPAVMKIMMDSMIAKQNRMKPTIKRVIETEL